MPITLGLNLAITVTVTIVDGGGDPGSPTPLVSSDFKNGVYAINGVSKTLGEVWEEDSVNWGGIWNAGYVSPGVGVVTVGNDYVGPIVSAEAIALLSGGFVAVATVELTDINTMTFELLDLPNFDPDYNLTIAQATATITDGATSDQIAITGGPHKYAFKMHTAECALSVDGSAAVSINPADGVANAFAFGGRDYTLEKIEFFSLADYDASDLPALSA